MTLIMHENHKYILYKLFTGKIIIIITLMTSFIWEQLEYVQWEYKDCCNILQIQFDNFFSRIDLESCLSTLELTQLL